MQKKFFQFPSKWIFYRCQCRTNLFPIRKRREKNHHPRRKFFKATDLEVSLKNRVNPSFCIWFIWSDSLVACVVTITLWRVLFRSVHRFVFDDVGLVLFLFLPHSLACTLAHSLSQFAKMNSQCFAWVVCWSESSGICTIYMLVIHKTLTHTQTTFSGGFFLFVFSFLFTFISFFSHTSPFSSYLFAGLLI